LGGYRWRDWMEPGKDVSTLASPLPSVLSDEQGRISSLNLL
jgi:hypothetical protein